MNSILSCCDSCFSPQKFHLQGDEKEVRSLIANPENISDETQALSCLEVRKTWQQLPKSYGASRGLICNDWKYTCRRPLLAWLPTAISVTLACETLFFVSSWLVADSVSTNDFNAMKVLCCSMFGISTLVFGIIGLSTCCCFLPNCCDRGSIMDKIFLCGLPSRRISSTIVATFTAAVINALFFWAIKNEENVYANHNIWGVVSIILFATTAVALGALGLGCFCCCVVPACNTTYKRMKKDIDVREIYVDGSPVGDRLCNYQCCVDPTCSCCPC